MIYIEKVLLLILGIVLVLISLALVGYPFVGSYLNSLNSNSEVLNYLNVADSLTNDEYADMLAAAKNITNPLLEILI